MVKIMIAAISAENNEIKPVFCHSFEMPDLKIRIFCIKIFIDVS